METIKETKMNTEEYATNTEVPDNQIQVVNIKYTKTDKTRQSTIIPDILSFEIPEGLLKVKSNTEKFISELETFVYNSISRKYGVEVNFCQIFLPLE